MVAEIDRLLGENGARPPRPLEVTAAVTADDAGGLRVHLEIAAEGGARTRDLQAASCDALADAAAVIVALTIDPAAVAAAPPAPSPVPAPPAPSPAPAPPDPAPLPVPAGPAPAAPPSPRVVPRFHLEAWALADAGSLPGVSFAAGGVAALGLGAFRVELGAGAFPARAQVVARPAASGAAAGGDVSLIAGSAGLCYDVLPSVRFDLAPCAAFEIGRMHASGFGVSNPGAGDALWTAARAGARFAYWPVSRAAVVVRVEGVVPMTRPGFVLENLGSVYRPGPVAGRLGGGVEVRF